MRRIVLVLAVVLASSCGKKGPPLPPLVKLPSPPADFTAVRRGDRVDLQFTVPSTNTDNTRPANVERVEVYALDGGATVSDAEVMKRGARVASVAVKSPRNPDQTIESNEPAEDLEPLEGPGLGQGTVARILDQLGSTRPGESPASSTLVPARTYLAVGIAKRGRRGPASKSVAVPLVAPPLAPPTPTITYNETAVTVTWTPVSDAKLSYNVYEVPTPLPPSAASGVGQIVETQLTKAPVTDTRFNDPRITWGATRCYAVRAVEKVDELSVESDEGQPSCVALKDTFPPAQPQGLMAVAGEGAISLIWEPNNEKDLDGYLVVRATTPGGELTQVGPLIHETTFRDSVPPGAHYEYGVRAADKAGNVSAPSSRVDETAR